MTKQQLYVTTSAQMFSDWLLHCTSAVFSLSFPTEKGVIGLQRARKDGTYGAPMRVKLDGSYQYRWGDEEVVMLLESVIVFTIVPLSQDRIEVLAEYTQPVVEPYFKELLEAIGERWPSPLHSSGSRSENPNDRLMEQVDELRTNQSAIRIAIERIEASGIKPILDELREMHTEQRDAATTLNGARKALRILLDAEEGAAEEHKEILNELNGIVSAEYGVQQQIELSVPLLPKLLTYKASASVDQAVNVAALAKRISSELIQLADRFKGVGE